jgi:SAM-dependent methyltransferase
MRDKPGGLERIQGLMTGFWNSKALFTGVELGLFDELAKGLASAEILGYRLKLNPNSLERLMNALVALELLSKTDGRYKNTEETESYLVRGKPSYLGGQVEHLSQLHWRLWQYLPEAVRENSPRVQQVFGPVLPILEAVSADPQRLRAFVQGIHNMNVPAAEEIVNAFDFSQFERLIDVGGGSGALAIAAATKWPNLECLVLELPAVCDIAQEHIQQYPVSDRVKVQPGDFFAKETIPINADIIVLGWVLRDWPAYESQLILKNCYHALKPRGVILVCEKLLDENRTGPLQTTLMDLQALVSTGGQERTWKEYESWMESAGFIDIDVKILMGNRDIIFGYKH